MQVYDFSVAVGGGQLIQTAGSYVRYLTGSAGGLNTRVRVRHGASGSVIELMPGQAFRFDTSATDWYVTNAAGEAAIVGRLAIGDGAFEDSRVVGEVSVVDGGKSRTMAGVAMMAAAYQAGLAANFAHVQLWNKPASGKRLVVEALSFNTDAGAGTRSFVGFGGNAAQLTNLLWVGQSKLIGGAASAAAEIRGQLNATALLSGSSQLVGWGVDENLSTLVRLSEPVVINPGFGLVVYAALAGADVGASFEWYEELV